MKSKFTKFKQLALAMAFLFLVGMSFAQSTTMTKSFTSSESWIIPDNVTEITIECVGGGGAGGYVHGSGFYFEASAGGGGGAYAKQENVTVTPGQTIYITVGAGGHAWATSGNQVDGGDTYVTINSAIVVKAAGGKTVKGENNTSGAAGGSTSNCIGTVTYSGGNGGGSVTHKLGFQEPGGGGGAAGSGGVGNNGSNGSGGAARADYGGNGADPKSIIGKGNTGGNYGGGGSGAECTGWGGEYGGEGANGYVIITYDATPKLIVDDMTDMICSGESFNVIPTGTIPDGTTYSWSAPSVTGITGTTSGTDASSVSGTLTNETTADINVVYDVTAKKVLGSTTVTDIFTVTVTVHALPVINSLTPSDTCPNKAFYIIIPDITSTSNIVTNAWTGTTNGTDTIVTAATPNCGLTHNYSLQVVDENGCVSAKVDSSFTVASPSYTPIVSVDAIFNSAACEFSVPDMEDTVRKAFKSACDFIDTYTQDSIVGAIVAADATTPVPVHVATICGTNVDATINVISSPQPGLSATDVEFDDKNDTITLYYGVCDTLYYVNIPTYSATSSSAYSTSDFNLTNDKGGSVNEGTTLLGRISGGEYTIIWRLTSPCGNYIEFPKKYVVMYPPCGGDLKATDADGIEYESVRIGCECWTKTNLRTVTGVTGNSYVYQDDPANETKFGRLYSWYSAVGLAEDATTDPATVTDPKTNKPYVQGICPAGWALPTADAYVNMVTTAGGVNNIKSSDASTWLPEIAGTDASGFGAVGAGYYTDQEFYYYNLLGEAYFWTCEGEPVYKKGTCCSITLTCPTLLINTVKAGRGLSVRCVKRNE